MRRKLRTQLSVGFVLLVLVFVSVISLTANILIHRQFENMLPSSKRHFQKNWRML